MFNFQDAVAILLESKAALKIEDSEGLYLAIKFLLDNPEERKILGTNAKEAVSRNAGSGQRTIDLILDFSSP